MTRAWPAPAKLNLYLHVVGRRPDGYHLLDSLVAFADIGDTVTAVPAGALSLTIEGPCAGGLTGRVEDNLVWRAAVMLAAHLGRAPAAALTLTKTLPVASGIGGGSSDAAASLSALLDLWGETLTPDALHAVAQRLGADVPVCLAGRTAWLGGSGEEVTLAPALPAVGVVLVNCGAPLATPAVFAGRRGAFSSPARFAVPAADACALAAALGARRNDLTAAACALVPEIAQVLERLAAADGALIARMSGSGATCFGLFATPTAAAAAAARLQAAAPQWWVRAGRLLP